MPAAAARADASRAAANRPVNRGFRDYKRMGMTAIAVNVTAKQASATRNV